MKGEWLRLVNSSAFKVAIAVVVVISTPFIAEALYPLWHGLLVKVYSFSLHSGQAVPDDFPVAVYMEDEAPGGQARILFWRDLERLPGSGLTFRLVRETPAEVAHATKLPILDISHEYHEPWVSVLTQHQSVLVSVAGNWADDRINIGTYEVAGDTIQPLSGQNYNWMFVSAVSWIASYIAAYVLAAGAAILVVRRLAPPQSTA